MADSTRTPNFGLQTGPKVPVSIVNDTSGENHTGCNAVISALLALCEAHGLDVIERLTRRQILDGIPPPKCALTIINGEGSLHHNTSQAQFFPKLLQALDMLQQPAVLINSVWDTPDFMGERKRYWRLMEKWVRLVSVRESLSYKQYAAPDDPARVPRRDALITPDLSFWHLTRPEIQKVLTRAVPRHFIGYSDSLPPEFSANLKDNEMRLELPLSPARSIAHFIAHLGDCHTYHTARFHGACFALMAGVPKIVTYPANTHKIEGLMADARSNRRPQPYLDDAAVRINVMMGQVAAIARQEAVA